MPVSPNGLAISLELTVNQSIPQSSSSFHVWSVPAALFQSRTKNADPAAKPRHLEAGP